ncbi:hypothetical protein H4R99_002752 [Coemansia sp. RSA 1722]|nr:hypothetical protein H4R99_002752 [Coemansia sp. RSA 1722]
MSIRARASTAQENGDDAPAPASDEQSSDPRSAHTSLLDEPERYASDIRGELVAVPWRKKSNGHGFSKVDYETRAYDDPEENVGTVKSTADQQPDFDMMLAQYQNYRDLPNGQASDGQFDKLTSNPQPNSHDHFYDHGLRRVEFGFEHMQHQTPLPEYSSGHMLSGSMEAAYASPFLHWSPAVPHNLPLPSSQPDLGYLHPAIDPYIAPPSLHHYSDSFANNGYGQPIPRELPLQPPPAHVHAHVHGHCQCHFNPHYPLPPPPPPPLPPPPPPPPPPPHPLSIHSSQQRLPPAPSSRPFIFSPTPIDNLAHTNGNVSAAGARIFEEGEVADTYAIPSTLGMQTSGNSFARLCYSPAPGHQEQGPRGHGFLSIESDRRDDPLSDGEVSEHLFPNIQTSDSDERMPTSLFRKDGQLDVEGIIKSRVESVLKLKDPTLLRNASFRALMLMLKCVKLTTSDAVQPVVDGATLAVVSELNLIAQEFGLTAVADACANRLSETTVDPLQTTVAISTAVSQCLNISTQASQQNRVIEDKTGPVAASNNDARAATIPPVEQPSNGAPAQINENQSSSDQESARASSPDVDMDTSSDAEYEHEFGTPTSQIRRVIPPLTQAFVATPFSMSHFSRSRAPSPPSAQPRTPRKGSFFGRSSHIHLDLINQALGGSAVGTPSPVQLPRAVSATPLPKRLANDSPISNVEHTLCNSESGRLVVYIHSSDESSDSDIGYDGDMDGPESVSQTDGLEQQGSDENLVKERALRRQVRMLNKECRRLALQNNSGTVSRAASFSSLVRLNAGANAAAALVRPRLDDSSDRLSNGALLETKMSLKAKEEAIAQLKLEISRKQAKMLLRKKLQEAKLRTSSGKVPLPRIASAPSSPLSAEANANAADAEKAALSASVSPAPTHELITGDSLVSTSSDQPADSPNTPNVVNCLEITPAKHDSSPVSEKCESHEKPETCALLPLLTNETKLPETDIIERSISSAAVDKRAEYASRYMDLLQESLNSKRCELDSLSKPHLLTDQQYLDHLKSSAASAFDRLEEKSSRLSTRKASTLKLIEKLQSELLMTDLELGILAYARDANTSFRSTLGASSSSQELTKAEPDNRRQQELRRDIAKIYQRITTIHKVAGVSQIVEPTQSPAAPGMASSLDSGGSADTRSADAKVGVAGRSTNASPHLTKPDEAGVIASKPDHSTGADSKKRILEEMRAKMAMMKSQQNETAKKLGGLLEKRRLNEQQQQQQQQVNGDETLFPARKRHRGSSLSTVPLKTFPIDTFLKSIARISKRRADEAKTMRLFGLGAVDNCILQPLVVADGIGLSGSVGPLIQNVLDTGGIHTVEAFCPPVLVKPTASHSSPNQSLSDAYKSYDSPLGQGSGSAASNVDEQNADMASFVYDRRRASDPLTVADFTAAELNQISQASIFEALHMSPADDPPAIKSYYEDMKTSLGSIRLSANSTASISAIVAAMLPVWAKYRHFGYKKSPMGPKNPLYRVFYLDSAVDSNAGERLPGITKPSCGAHSVGPSLCGPDQLRRCKAVLERCVNFPPIVNSDVIQIIRSPQKPRPSQRNTTSDVGMVRYYDAAASKDSDLSEAEETVDSDEGGSSGLSDDDDEGGADGSDMDISTNPSSPVADADEDEDHIESTAATCDDLYHTALRILQKGSPFGGKVPSMAKLLAFLHARGNMSVGRAIRFLAKALQKYPESEKLWDLYLELYLRQTTDTDEIVSVFSDATKFHALSVKIWLRYVHWCGWNSINCKGSPSEIIAWHKRLSMVIATAIRCLIKNTDAVLDEHMSAAVAEMIVYSWECSWSLLTQPNTMQAINTASKHNSQWFTRGALVAHMLGCIVSKSRDKLLQRISAMPIETSLVLQRDNLIDSNIWSGADWVLCNLLLPHHLLFVCQVFVHCFVTSDLVPASVMAGMRGAMQSGACSQTTYYIDLDKLVKTRSSDTQLLDSHVAPVLNKVFGSISSTLSKISCKSELGDVSSTTLSRSCELCQASIDRTMAQLNRISPLNDSKLDTMHLPLLVDCAENVDMATDLDIQRIRSLILDIAESSTNFLPLAQLLCSISQRTDKQRACYLATCALRDYALILGARLGISDAANKPNDWPAKPASKQLLGQWIHDARAVFYSIIGYTGKGLPESMAVLEADLANSDVDTVASSDNLSEDGECDSGSLQLDSRKHFGTWVIVAFCELLCLHYSADKNTLDRTYVRTSPPLAAKTTSDCVQLWLRSGLKYIADEDVGGRAYIWAMLLQLIASEQRLSQSDLVSMKNDLTGSGNTADVQCFVAINSAVRAVLCSNPSSVVLEEIGLFVSYSARTDVELGVR